MQQIITFASSNIVLNGNPFQMLPGYKKLIFKLSQFISKKSLEYFKEFKNGNTRILKDSRRSNT